MTQGVQWDASLFLNGARLQKRGFGLVALATQGVELERLDPTGLAGNVGKGGYSSALIGYADGGFSQPLGSLCAEVMSSGVTGFGDFVLAPQPMRIWCGDGDSVPKGFEPEGFSLDTEWLQRNKDISDGAALFEAVKKSILAGQPHNRGHAIVIEIIGALGLRRDHEMCNLAEIRQVFFGPGCLDPFVVVVQPSLVLANVTITLDGFPVGLPISVFSSNPMQQLSMSGLAYGCAGSGSDLGSVRLQRPSHGLSNVVSDSSVRIGIESAGGAGERGFYEVVMGHDESVFF
jgi:thiamine pyrophosphokinase